MNIKDDFILKDINTGYLVGGSVRDFLMGKDFSDRDIAIINAEDFAKNLAEKLDATFIVLDSENKIYRLVLKDKKNYLDISELRGKTIAEDLLKRDFTINAIAYDLKENKFIDVTGGIEDIKNKVLREIDEQNFIDDPLRILRAFRFEATTGFKIENSFIEILKKHKLLLQNPAKERVHDEIMKLFGGNYTSQTLINMLDTGVLELIFPCVTNMKKVPPNSHHHLDLIHHVIETVRQIELQYENYLDKTDKNNEFDSIEKTAIIEHILQTDFGGYPRINHIKIAGFLHDIGKFDTWTIENENGKERHRFIKHDSLGSKLAIPLLKSLKFSNKQIEYISEMIKQHIYPSNVIAAPNLDNKIMMRYIRKMGDNVIDNIILAKADRLSAQGEDITEEMTKNNITGLNKLLKFYLEVKPTLKPIPKLLDGREIMQILDIKQSPMLGKIIIELHEAQLNGEINTKEEAVEFVKKYQISNLSFK